MKFIDKSKQRYGRLLVIERNGVNKHGQAQFNCLCDCGNYTTVTSGNLGRSHTSCGCARRERAVAFNRLRPYEALYRRFLREAAHPVGLTFEDFLYFTKIPTCHYCGVDLKWQPFKNGTGYNLDRKDNALGYSFDNCVPCCKRCNIGKGSLFTYEEWLEIGNLIRSWKK